MPLRPGPGPVTAGLIIAAAVLLSGCGGAEPTTSSSGAAIAAAPNRTGSSSQRENSGRVTCLAPAGQDIVYTASMTVHVTHVGHQAARAAQIASNAGGYVSTEDAALLQGQPGRPAASIQLKIPVTAYPAALRELAGLGRQTFLRQQAQDITLDVADTASRVASAQAAIAELRALLSRAGSVRNLLTVQQQINEQESALEALQSRQRALNHEVTYATVSLRLVGPVVTGHAAGKHPQAGGFIGGLKAGWTALVAVISWLLRTIGAVLPIGAACALAGYLAYRGLRGRRWPRRGAG